MRRLFSSLIVGFLLLSLFPPISFAVVPVAAIGEAVNIGASIYTISEFAGVVKNQLQQWLEDHPGSTPSQYPGYTGGVTIDDDGFSGHDGEFEGPVDYHGFGSWKHDDKSFNDFDSAYQDYVSDLPCGSSYDSTGKLLWSPYTTFNFVPQSGSDSIEDHFSNFNVSLNDNSLTVVKNENSSGNIPVDYLVSYHINDSAPITGDYNFQKSNYFLIHEYIVPKSDTLNTKTQTFRSVACPSSGYYQSGTGIVFDSTGFYPNIGSVTYIKTLCNNPVYEITPIDNDPVVTNNYNDNSRAWSLTGGLALTNISGGLTTINPDVKIVNETNNTYTNPETGITYPVSEWTYDYSDRSYTLHLDTTNVEEGDTIGDTVVVTYGDENITINEQHITYEGDTPVTTTETIPVYYIIENPQSQDPDDPGTVVDPGSDPDDSGCSCLCTNIGQQIAAGAFAYTNSGSGDFYSYVNIANGGTTTNTNTYNYYGSGPHDPTPTDPSTDPEEPGEHTHVYTEEVLSSPTCEDSGSSLWICSCGDHYTDHSDPLGHDFVYTTVPATCTEDGSKYKTCSRCGLVQQTEVIPAPGHDWFLAATESDAVYNPETGEFEQSGPLTYVYECSRCGMRYYSEVDDPPPANYGTDEEPGFLDVIPNAFSSLAEFVSNLLSTVTGLCTNFTNFLVVVFPFIPVEFITVLELGFALFITAGVIRYFLR